jgi:hypothetical protein
MNQMITKKAVVAIVFLILEENHNYNALLNQPLVLVPYLGVLASQP